MASTITADTGAVSGSAGLKQSADSSGVLALATGTGTTAVTIDASQNVGIGTSSPVLKTEVRGAGGAPATSGTTPTGITAVSNGDTYGTLYTGAYAVSPYALWMQGASRAALGTYHDIALQPNGGNVGIGTSSPSNKLHVIGSTGAYASRIGVSATGAQLFTNYVLNDGVSPAGVGYTGSDGSSFDVSASNYLRFLTNSTERARIDSSGNFILASSGSFYSVGVYNSTTANGANMYVSSGGSFNRSTSALKYKQDVRDLESVDITKFRAVRYKSKCENDDQTKDHFGFIADEVLEAGIPELVNYGDNGEVEGFQYERMTAVLLKAIQEQQSMITSQSEQISSQAQAITTLTESFATLTARIEALENPQ